MTTHTIGPWHRNIKPATKYTTVWSGRNKHVAYVAVNGLTPEEIEGNITLIASAPATHDAARAMLAALEESLGWVLEVRPETEQRAKALRQIRAAIAAAKAAGL